MAPGFDAFYRDVRPPLYRALAMTLRDTDLAAEAVDEAMVRAYQRWSSVSRHDNPAGWAYRVAHNWAVSAMRRRKWRVATVSGTTEAPPLPDPELAQALTRLSTPQRTVIVLRFHLDWSLEQIATALGVPMGTVKSRLHRALASCGTRWETTMDIERRLHDHFAAAGDHIPDPADRLQAVARRGRRRRLVQNGAVGLTCLALVAGAGLALRYGDRPDVEFQVGATPPAATADSQTPSPPPTEQTEPANPTRATATEIPPEEVAMEALGGPVIAYGGRRSGLRVYADDGEMLILSGDVDMAIADNADGLVVQTGKTISWLPEADPEAGIALVRRDEPITLRAMLPDGRVLYSVPDTERSEDMVERYFAVALEDEAAPELLATDSAFEYWTIGPAATADDKLVMAGCHMMCSVFPWPDDTATSDPGAVYHGNGGKQGPTAAIEGLASTPDGRVIGMVEYHPTPDIAPPEVVVLDGASFEVLATIVLPVDKARAVGGADVSLSADGQRVLVSVESRIDDVDAPWRRDTFLFEDITTDNPGMRRVKFDGVIRWL